MKLSICIPTYNFGAFIGATLDSVLADRPIGVEVVVLDGGSTDDTSVVVDSYARRFPDVRYVRNPARGGIDADMAATMDLAAGEYCWLFSADDLMKSAAVKRILAEIESGYDLYLAGLTICDGQMNVLGEHPVLEAAPGSLYRLDDEDQRRDYFCRALTTTAFFSFMGSIVIKRTRWKQVQLDPDFVGSCWAHVVRILRLIPRGLTVKYLGESFLLKRGDNDSFMDRGIAYRFAIAIDGYHRIAASVFGKDSFEARQMRRVIVNEFPPNAFFSAKLQSLRTGRPEDVQLLDRLAAAAYGDPTPRNLMKRAIHAALSVRAYESARYTYRRLRGKPVP